MCRRKGDVHLAPAYDSSDSFGFLLLSVDFGLAERASSISRFAFSVASILRSRFLLSVSAVLSGRNIYAT
jgi:hypothetical protein